MSGIRSQEPSGAPRNESRATRKKQPRGWVTPTLALVAAVGVGIFGGVLIGQHTTSSSSSQATGFRGGAGGAQGATAGGAAAGGVTSGTVVSVKGNTIVLKTASGSDVTVTTSSATSVTQSSKSSVTDLKAGETVTAIGQSSSSGDIAATTISEGSAPAHGFGGAGGASGTSGANG